MVGYFAGVVQVPITSTIIVMEMTNDPSLRLPLLATAFIGYHASKIICPKPLYRALAESFLAHTKRHGLESEDAPPVLA
jgi:H+/Cl- antiporter ClcA